MKINITSQEYNPLLKRKEITFEVKHEKTGGTPPRFEVRKELATMLKMDSVRVYVKRMTTKTGTRTALGTANAYDSIEQAKLVEPQHIIERNAPPKKPEEKKEAVEKKKKAEKGEKPKKKEKEEKVETTEKKKEKKGKEEG